MSIRREKQEELVQKMNLLGIKEEDIEETFVRSGGPGGQKLNKTSNCVVLKYKPEGIVIKCQQDRARAVNRFLCRRKLVEKMEIMLFGRQSDREKKIQKIRKQKKKKRKKNERKTLHNAANTSNKRV